MKKPQTPPVISEILRNSLDDKKIDAVMHRAVEPPDDYPHWDKLRHLTPPDGLPAEEWWLGIKLRRGGLLKDIPLLGKEGKSFRFGVPDLVQAELHDIDVGAGRSIGIPEPITNPQTRDR